LKQKTRLLVGVFVAADVLATNLAWVLAYLLRFDVLGGLIPVTKGVPEASRYVLLLPFISLLWPAVLYFHGLYRPKRGRSRIDELFAITSSVLVASLLTLGATLYLRVYHFYQDDVAPLWEYSQAVFALFALTDVVLLYAGRATIRAWLERRWAAGHNVERVAVAGAGELGRRVAETILAHRELGYRVVGFLDDDDGLPAQAPAGLPVLGRLDEAAAACRAHGLDQIYVALPLEDHAKIVGLIKSLGTECVDVKVVPDLVQYATIRAALEDLDGVPIISLNEVPLRGFNSMVKRLLDVAAGGALLLFLCTAFPILPAIALAIRLRGGPGPILLRQERMTLDGKTFQIFKFRTMVDGAEDITGPIFATADDPRRTAIGVWLRRYNLDELPQLINVVLGDMSLVGPRPERPPFVAQFKEKIPQYMQRHRVKSGITGWAQVNGWRGNSSIEKRIEYDLYYIENWSLTLDLKILVLTLFRGFGQDHAY
jgi:Undecaprenyl-phosphate glucose phosphotransferase